MSCKRFLREMARSTAQLFLPARGARLTSRPAGQHRRSDPFSEGDHPVCVMHDAALQQTMW
jgi:hypothetical protein